MFVRIALSDEFLPFSGASKVLSLHNSLNSTNELLAFVQVAVVDPFNKFFLLQLSKNSFDFDIIFWFCK